VLVAGLEEQRDVRQRDTRARWQVREPLIDLAIDARVNDRLEICARGRIAENNAAERFPIQGAVRKQDAPA